MIRPSGIVVFVGPTLTLDRCRGLLAADYRPPAGQGDLYATVQTEETSVIVLIDGVFQTEPAVRHKEILWALHQGVRVYGAASMGALRAVELAPFGMAGIGSIYRWFRRFPMTPDDAVAVAQAPPELDSKPLSVALVDLIATFRAARRAGAIDRRIERRLGQAAVALHYQDRTMRSVVARALGAHSGQAVSELTANLQNALVEQKQKDAVSLLTHVSRMETPVLPRQPAGTESFVITDSWYQDLMVSGQSPPPVAES